MILWLKGKCLFCGSNLDHERIKAIQTRIGRINFLLRATKEGSKTAEEVIYNILALGEHLGGKDIPEDNPDWWIDIARKISYETEKD